MLSPKVSRSSQYAARNGFVCFDVGRLAFAGSLVPCVLPPNSIQPLVEIVIRL